MDRFFEGLDVNSVGVDNEQASFDATLHLVSNQFKNIGFVTIDSNKTRMKDRLSGYEKAILENGLKTNVLKIKSDEVLKAKEKDCIKDFLNGNNNLDAFFFCKQLSCANWIRNF